MKEDYEFIFLQQLFLLNDTQVVKETGKVLYKLASVLSVRLSKRL